ncbi:thiamine phosphate synthase [Alloacidobacterium sp.]|uniref:thiamine phosphate synthase n=1 Tax=Alloacidobacterium sp. TaxID=2951999 RepID=UPI002D2F3C7E|nr:thiamine phosphate synthase [Alloacidobacterium sp.]HYK36884.1 thiamine phosphate synthase [Alloacidobacterium sp.]
MPKPLHFEKMQLYAITDRTLFPSVEELVRQTALWAKGGVDFIQIREKDLAAEELYALSVRIVHAVKATGGHTRVLQNGSPEIAAETGCDGFHLTAGLPSTAIAAAKTVVSRVVANPVISISCHTVPEIEIARDAGATLALFAPVFEKQSGPEIVSGQGLDALAHACRVAAPMPVFALGGVTAENAQKCIQAGATGIAGIRLFAHHEWRNLCLSG